MIICYIKEHAILHTEKEQLSQYWFYAYRNLANKFSKLKKGFGIYKKSEIMNLVFSFAC